MGCIFSKCCDKFCEKCCGNCCGNCYEYCCGKYRKDKDKKEDEEIDNTYKNENEIKISEKNINNKIFNVDIKSQIIPTYSDGKNSYSKDGVKVFKKNGSLIDNEENRENREQIEMGLIDANEDQDSKIGLNHKYEEQKQLLEQERRESKKIKEELEKNQEKLNEKIKELNNIKEKFNNTNKQLNDTEKVLKNTKEELEKNNVELNKALNELDNTKEKLNETQEKLNETEKELKSTKEDLDKSKETLEKTKEDFYDRQKDLDEREENIIIKENEIKEKEEKNNINIQSINLQKEEISEKEKEIIKKEKSLKEKETEFVKKNQELIQHQKKFNQEKIFQENLMNQKEDSLNKLDSSLKQIQSILEEEKKDLDKQKEKLELSKIPNEVGLQNIGATCYMNATLQALSNTDNFTEYFLTKYHFDPSNNSKRMSNEMYKVLSNLWDENKKKGDYPPYDFKNSLSEENPLFAGIQANDSKDLINFLLERFHQEMNNPPPNNQNNNIMNVNQMNEMETLNAFIQEYFSANKSIISDCFYGLVETKSTCGGCNITKYNFQIYSFLEFPLKEVNTYMYQNGRRYALVNQDGTNPDIDLYECFDYYQKLDLMTGQNQMYCNICNMNTNTYYGTTVYSLPNYLIINLNRGKGATYKCNVNFPEVLNLLNYVTAKHGVTTMKLYAVICHYGESSMSGHFIAYCKHRINKKWYIYNDSIVKECKEPNPYNKGMPYILFYQAV